MKNRFSLGRSDFGGIDNENIDFSHLEEFINNSAEVPAGYFAEALAASDGHHVGNRAAPTPG